MKKMRVLLCLALSLLLVSALAGIAVADERPTDGWWTNSLGHKHYYRDGERLSGLQEIDGAWYYFYASGAMAADTEIDGYLLSASGAMI